MIIQLRSPGFRAEIDLDEVSKAYRRKVEFFDDDIGKDVKREELTRKKVKKLLKLIVERSDPSDIDEVGYGISELYPKLYPIWKEVTKDVC